MNVLSLSANMLPDRVRGPVPPEIDGKSAELLPIRVVHSIPGRIRFQVESVFWRQRHNYALVSGATRLPKASRSSHTAQGATRNTAPGATRNTAQGASPPVAGGWGISPECLLNALAAVADRTFPSFELSFNPASRRFLLVCPGQGDLRKFLEKPVPMPRNLPGGLGAHHGETENIRRGSRESGKKLPVEGESPIRSALHIIFPEVARFLLVRALTPRWLKPILTAFRVWPYVWRGVGELAGGRLSVPVLDASAITASAATGDIATSNTIGFMLDLGQKLEDWTKEQTRRSLTALIQDVDGLTWVRRNQIETAVPASTLEVGDLVIIRAGSRIPIDGLVVEGEGMVNQSMMTGESHPKSRRPGHSVWAGTVLTEGCLVVRATEVGRKTRFANIIRVIEASEAFQGDAVNQAHLLAERTVPWIFGLAGLIGLLSRSLARMAALLVVDFSCSLKLATPLAIKTGMIEAAAKGIIFKGGRYLETLSRTDAILFDKTGTLTQARPRVAEVYPLNGFTREFVLRQSACLEEHFPHPVARAVVEQAIAEGLNHEEKHAAVEYVLAHGIASYLDGQRILVGSGHFVHDDEGVDLGQASELVCEIARHGHSVLYMAVGGKLAGILAIEDPLLETAPWVIGRLRRMGLNHLSLLTGDNAPCALEIAGKLGISEVHSEVMPDDKTRLVRDLQESGKIVVMLGDGMNDAAALARADVGISLKHGADVAREAADVLILGESLTAFPLAIHISRRTMSRVRQNFWLTIGVNGCLLAAGLTGIAPSNLLAVLHNVNTLGICTLAMRPILPRNS